ncbi:PQQ-binding-like beta-propeller repeat protein [Streptomyces sannanensis]|uniref:PQQ-binding-like beta-propeller repeat protein n=1 Tax=Streptomyces sannanensis TaxID=285536 RepID=A0ABP6SBE4_9ACTN
MTQPPSPPNQPPAQPPPGGFGVPQDPPPGGFGVPQDPPPGGFGAPQTPAPADAAPGQQPPQAPSAFGPPQAPAPGRAQPAVPAFGGPQAPVTPGYGQPQAPAPGYGYPQTPPGGQPGYGYPNQPAYGSPQGGPYGQQPPTQPMQPQHIPPQPAGPGGGKKSKAQMTIIIAAVVAIALIVGTGVWYSSGKDDTGNQARTGSTETGKGGDDKGGDGPAGPGPAKEKAPADVNSKVLFQLPLPKVTGTTTIEGSWLTDTLYVKNGVNEVVGYDAVKGTQAWKTPLPGPVCAASRHVTSDDRTAIVFQPRVPTKADKYPGCTEVAALDLTTGKLLWQKSVNDGDTKADFKEVTVAAGVVAAGGLYGGAAWDVNTGAALWQPQASTDQCQDRGYAGGEALVAVRKCGDFGQEQLTVQVLDTKAKGAVLSTYKLPAGVKYAHVVSTEPLVVAADVGETAGDGSEISDFFSVDGKTGKLLARIPADAEKYGAECQLEVESCSGAVVGNNRLYVMTEEHDGTGDSYSQTNEIVAFDLATGKPVPGKADAGNDYIVTPLRMDGPNVIAYKKPPYDKGGQVVSIDGTTLKETLLMENPADEATRSAESRFLPRFSEIRFGGGRLYFSQVLLSEPTGSDIDGKYLTVAFGTG